MLAQMRDATHLSNQGLDEALPCIPHLHSSAYASSEIQNSGAPEDSRINWTVMRTAFLCNRL